MKLKYLPILFMSILALVSCSDDDDDPVVAPVESETVFAESNLKFTYSGAEVSDKEVLFTPDANDVTAATIVIRDITTKAENANGTKIFNGEKEVTFPIVMEITGDMGVFGGSAESKYYTFEYRGNVHEEILQLEIINVNRNETIMRPLENEKTFSGKELNLKVSGNNILGKNVCFTPDANDPFAATLTFRGDRMNVEEMMNRAGNDFATSSVFAAEAEVILPITLSNNNDNFTFSGQGESKYFKYSYTGSVTEELLNVELTDVVLKNNPIANTSWKIAPVITNDWGESESTPFIIEWKADKMIDLDMFGSVVPMPVEDVLKMALGVMPLIEMEEGKKVTIAEAIVTMLQVISFENDGNLKAAYIDMKTKKPAVSPYGVAQYVVEGDKIKLVLNPFAIAANAQKDNNAQAEENPMAGVMQALVPTILNSINAEEKLTNGINITYNIPEEGKMSVCVDETLILPVLKIFAPMLQNEELINAAVEMLKQNPDMAAFAPTMGSVLKALPEVINTTTSMKIGLNLIKM